MLEIVVNNMNISIVIPVFNEEDTISNTLKTIKEYLTKRRFKYELIVVDDGSKDKTASLLKKHPNIKILLNKKNMGKGYSVKRGVMSAKLDWILFSDVDLSTPIEELDKFIALKDECDVLIGSRNLPESIIEIKQPPLRSAMGKMFSILVRLLFLKGINDSQCGFKLFRKAAAKNIFKRLTIEGFSFDIEALLIARKLGYSIKEIPVRWKNRKESKVRLFSDPIRMFIDIISLKFRKLR